LEDRWQLYNDFRIGENEIPIGQFNALPKRFAERLGETFAHKSTIDANLIGEFLEVYSHSLSMHERLFAVPAFKEAVMQHRIKAFVF
jgi:hypothetical protein